MSPPDMVALIFTALALLVTHGLVAVGAFALGFCIVVGDLKKKQPEAYRKFWEK